MLKGSCLCGGIRYEVDAALTQIALCHCALCRKASGSAFAANAPVPRLAFRMMAGAALLKAHESSPGKRRWFCARCGSPIYSESAKAPETIRLQLGLLDTPAGHAPDFHFMVGSKAEWYTIGDGLPQHEGFEPGRG
jgi:hypothetical protein